MTAFLTVDIEATSYEGCSNIEEMEVIEIGLAYVQNGIPTDDYATLVRPVRTKINHYCTKITGITPKMVVDAPTFSQAMSNIGAWVASLDEAPITWCSWGVYDRNHLALERRIHDAANPFPPLHVNAKKVFQKVVTPSGRQVGLQRALEIAGIDPMLPTHRALPDARNVAEIILKLELEGEFHRATSKEE